MLFAYRAMSTAGAIVSDAIDAASQSEAAELLRGQGLTILELSARPAAAAPSTRSGRGRGGGGRNLLIFTRQMKMLIESGAAVVPALRAIERQLERTAFGAVVRQVRDEVENGGALHEAFAARPRVFSPLFCAIVAAGEATGRLDEAFGRLAELTERSQHVRKSVLGAVLYPALLALLCLGVINVLLFFVLPRFRDLFAMLKTPLPMSTELMFALSETLRVYWPALLALAALPAAAAVALRCHAPTRARFDEALLGAPLLGRFVSRLILGRVLRIWAAMLRCHVPLIETIQQSRAAVVNTCFRRLLGDVEEAVASGGRIGDVLGETEHIDPVITSAIATGEENGRLAEAVDFVARWVDRDNEQMIAMATRIIEPALLALMGLLVGAVAMSLFLPLFDVATAA